MAFNNHSFGEDDDVLVNQDILSLEGMKKNTLISKAYKNEKYSGNDNEMCDQNNNDDQYNAYNDLLTREIVTYHLQTIYNIIRKKIIIKKTKFFISLKLFSNLRNTKLINAELLFLQMKSSLKNIFNIYKKKRHQVLIKSYNIWKMKSIINESNFSNNNNRTNNSNNNNKNKNNNYTVRQKLENKYRQEMENLLNRNSKNFSDLTKDIKDIEKNIKTLQKKDSDLKSEISNYSEKEKQLNDNIKNLENENNSISKYKQQSANVSSINNNSKYESEIHTLESTIENNKQLKDSKEEIIKMFYQKMFSLMNGYEMYIDNLFNENINNVNSPNVELSENSNQQSLSHKEGSANTCFTSQILSNRQSNRLHLQNNYSQGNNNIGNSYNNINNTGSSNLMNHNGNNAN